MRRGGAAGFAGNQGINQKNAVNSCIRQKQVLGFSNRRTEAPSVARGREGVGKGETKPDQMQPEGEEKFFLFFPRATH